MPRARDGKQVNPVLSLPLHAQLMDFCKAQKHSITEVIEAALTVYLRPTDQDAETLMFTKLNNLEQGMGQLVELLGHVIQHLEQQAKPPVPTVATREALYPMLGQPAVEEPPPVPEAVEDEGRVEARSSPWRRLFGRRDHL